jgi:hypothetical protein
MSIITEELIEQALATPGWAAFEDLTKKAAGDAKRLMDEARTEANIVGAALATPEGRRFLHWLIRKTLARPPAEQEMAAASSAEAYSIAKARREGQDLIVFMILHALEVARTGIPKAEHSGEGRK